MMDIIKAIEKENMKETVENFNIGDTVNITYKATEGSIVTAKSVKK